MSLLGFDIGLKALRTAQTALETIGHNVANANTPGYSRQRVGISASQPLNLAGLSFGTGVDAFSITRATDELVTKRIGQQRGVLGLIGARVDGLGQLEGLLGEPGSGGISALLDRTFAKASALAADPTELPLRTGFALASEDLASRFRSLSIGVDDVKSDAGERVVLLSGRANELSRQVANLNGQISQSETGGSSANDLRDQRDRAIQDLSDLVDVRTQQDQFGRISVTVGGRLIVGASEAYKIEATRKDDGSISMKIGGVESANAVRGGEIGGWLQIANDSAPSMRTKLDALAKSIIFEANKAHGTGTPGPEGFDRLTAEHPFTDADNSGLVEDDVLGDAGLPFDVSSGELWVQVIDRETGNSQATRIAIDPERTTVAGLVESLNSIDHISATVDAEGKLSVRASNGYGFDFTRRLAARPDAAGTFGGKAATLASSASGPFDVATGGTLDLTGSLSSFSVAFSPGDFETPSRATAGEMAAVLNANADFQANGLEARVVGGALAIRTQGEGASETFTVAGGSLLSELGWTAGQTVQGSDNAVDVAVTGEYSGSVNSTYSFRPTTDGTIGTTDGLQIEVLDQDGGHVATLDVGAGYVPGTKIALGDGVEVSFGLGTLSTASHDVFALDLVADSDTSDLVAAMGMNALYTGTNASDIALREDLALDPSKLALSGTGASGDASALDAFIALKDTGITSLEGSSIPDVYSNLVTGVGFEVATAASAQDAESYLLDSLEAQRAASSGVDVDQELVDMIAFEQAYSAAARYLQAVSQIQQELLQLL